MTTSNRPLIIPSLRYDNAKSAIEWLCRAFGFERSAVYEGEGDRIAHAQLTYTNRLGTCMVMLGSPTDDAFGKLIKPAKELGNVNTVCLSLIVDDVKAHYARAVEAGAKIVHPFEEKEYGGAGYGCQDPEGHLWHFGDYNPWEEAG